MLKIVEENLKDFLELYDIKAIVEPPISKAGDHKPLDIKISEGKTETKVEVKYEPPPVELVGGFIIGSYEKMEEDVLYLFPVKNDDGKRVGLFKRNNEIMAYREK